MKRVIFFVILSFIFFTVGCTKKGNTINVAPSLEGKETLVSDIACSFPLSKKRTTINVASALFGSEKYEDNYVWKKYAEMTNVDVNWTSVLRSERNIELDKILTNKKEIDLIMRFKTVESTVYSYGKDGSLIDLAKDNLLKKNAPNCWNYLVKHPDALASIMEPNGAIYSLPQINSGAELRVSRKIFINKKWLNNVNMKVPTTTEELYNVLKAFKNYDANGNGDKNDEIPFCPVDWDSIIEVLYGAFGLGNRGQGNLKVDYDEKNNKVRFIAASNEYKEFLQYLNKLYDEGLLYNNFANITKNEWNTNMKDNKVGIFSYTNLATVPPNTMDDWIAIGDALEGPNGDQLCSCVRANFHSVGAAMIPSTCSNPELILKWLDYFWTDEGTLFYHMGVEGETFYALEDGTYDYLPFIYEEMKNNNKSFDDTIINYSPYPGGGNPTVEIAPYFMGGEMAKIPADAARNLFKYGPTEYWPVFTFTEKENSTLNKIKESLDVYVKEKRIDYITGNESFDSWNDYIAQIEKYGYEELLDVYSDAVDRYYDLVNGNYKKVYEKKAV